jgi:hypothetical protein
MSATAHWGSPKNIAWAIRTREAGALWVEHYSNQGVLDCVVEGQTPTASYDDSD